MLNLQETEATYSRSPSSLFSQPEICYLVKGLSIQTHLIHIPLVLIRKFSPGSVRLKLKNNGITQDQGWFNRRYSNIPKSKLENKTDFQIISPGTAICRIHSYQVMYVHLIILRLAIVYYNISLLSVSRISSKASIFHSSLYLIVNRYSMIK